MSEVLGALARPISAKRAKELKKRLHRMQDEYVHELVTGCCDANKNIREAFQEVAESLGRESGVIIRVGENGARKKPNRDAVVVLEQPNLLKRLVGSDETKRLGAVRSLCEANAPSTLSPLLCVAVGDPNAHIALLAIEELARVRPLPPMAARAMLERMCDANDSAWASLTAQKPSMALRSERRLLCRLPVVIAQADRDALVSPLVEALDVMRERNPGAFLHCMLPILRRQTSGKVWVEVMDFVRCQKPRMGRRKGGNEWACPADAVVRLWLLRTEQVPSTAGMRRIVLPSGMVVWGFGTDEARRSAIGGMLPFYRGGRIPPGIRTK